MKVKVIISDKTGLRTDITQYPKDALREAISNMLIHRDYSQLKTGVYSIITVYKDRIEFRNVGNLYGSNTIQLLETRKAMEVRNETIVKLLETLGGIIENRHTGISTMQDKMKEASLPNPIFTNEREDFVVTFYNGEYPELYPVEIEKYKKAQETTQETTQEKYKILNESQINIIKENPSITQKDIANKLNMTRDGVKYNMNVLKELSIIKREGSTKKGTWLILK